MWESSGAEKGRLIPFNTFISHCIAPKPLAWKTAVLATSEEGAVFAGYQTISLIYCYLFTKLKSSPNFRLNYTVPIKMVLGSFEIR